MGYKVHSAGFFFFSLQNLQSFHNLSLGFIPEIFLRLLPRYSHQKIFSSENILIKKKSELILLLTSLGKKDAEMPGLQPG